MYLSSDNRALKGVGQAAPEGKEPAGPSPWTQAVPYVGVSTALFLGQSVIPAKETWQKILKTAMLAGGAISGGIAVATGMGVMASKMEGGPPMSEEDKHGLRLSGAIDWHHWWGDHEVVLRIQNKRSLPRSLMIRGAVYQAVVSPDKMERQWPEENVEIPANGLATIKVPFEVPLFWMDKRIARFELFDPSARSLLTTFDVPIFRGA